MKKLEEIEQDERDYVRLCVGSSQTYLWASRVHKVFAKPLKILSEIVPTSNKREIKVLLNSVITALKQGDTGTTITRNSKHYTASNKEHKLSYGKGLSCKRMIQCLNILEEHEYIVNYIGYKNVIEDKSMSSCFLFEQKLLDLFKGIALEYAPSVNQRFAEVRNEDGSVKKNVQGISTKEKDIEELDKWIDQHDVKFGILKKRLRLQQVFKNNLYTSGRIYFGALQTIKSEKRKTIQINDEFCVENDFSSQHIRIVASLEGIDLPKDFKPYDVDISDLVSVKQGYEPNVRKLIKFSIMMLLNSGNATSALKKIWKQNIDLITEYIEEGKWSKAKQNPYYGLSGLSNAKHIIKRIRTHNSFAEEYFKKREGAWGLLQNLDSSIIIRTLQILKEQGICALPYHDSAIVQSRYYDNLKQAMVAAWGEILGSDHNAVVDTKWDMGFMNNV